MTWLRCRSACNLMSWKVWNKINERKKYSIIIFKMRVPANGNFHLHLTDVWSNGHGADARPPVKISATFISHENGLRFIGLPNCDFICHSLYSVFIIDCVCLRRDASLHMIALQRPERMEFSHSMADRYRIIYIFNIAIISTVCVRRIWPCSPSRSCCHHYYEIRDTSIIHYSLFSNSFFRRSIVATALLFRCCHCFCFRRAI